MTQFARHSIPGDALASAPVAPLIRSENTASKNSTIRTDILPGHLESEAIKTAKSSQVRALKGSVEHEGLAVENFDLDNLILYQGPHLHRTKLPAPDFTPGSADYTLDSEEPYKPHSSWLVPITIEGSSTSAGLKEDFFVQHGAKTAHAVRETMRRPAGSHPNAEKTILVKAHIRGGYDVGDIGFMPTVTILREKA